MIWTMLDIHQHMHRAIGMAFALLVAIPFSPSDASAQTASPKFTPAEEKIEDYPAGVGREDTFYFCTACHGFKLVTQQGMTREQWDASLTWMSERHKMPVLAGKERDTILTYLATHYAPKTTGPQRGWKNPFQP
jgi:hypothetical protein